MHRAGLEVTRQPGSSASVGMMATAAGLLILLAVKTMSTRAAKFNPYLHGSARWAEQRDIEAAGLMPRQYSLFEKLRGKATRASAGVYMGAWMDQQGRRHYLRHNGPEHILCYAPTCSGKGVGLIVPTLLSWPDSAVITDLEGELWALTAGGGRSTPTARPTDKARLRPLMRILLNMIVRLLAERMDFEKGRAKAHYKHRLLMMLDEFPSLGKLEILQESLAYLAGYGIKCYLICQELRN